MEFRAVARTVFDTYLFATFSSDEECKAAFPLQLFAVTHHKLTLMTKLFNQLGPLVKSQNLAKWSHATVPLFSHRFLKGFNPYVSICVLGVGLAVIAVSPAAEISWGNKKISVASLVIRVAETAIDIASAVSAVALIAFGQPVVGGCTLVFLVVQVAARSGVFTMPKGSQVPWLVSKASFLQTPWSSLSLGSKKFLLNRNYLWVATAVGYGGAVFAEKSKEGQLSALIMGAFKVYLGPRLVDSKFLVDSMFTDKKTK